MYILSRINNLVYTDRCLSGQFSYSITRQCQCILHGIPIGGVMQLADMQVSGRLKPAKILLGSVISILF